MSSFSCRTTTGWRQRTWRPWTSLDGYAGQWIYVQQLLRGQIMSKISNASSIFEYFVDVLIELSVIVFSASGFLVIRVWNSHPAVLFQYHFHFQSVGLSFAHNFKHIGKSFNKCRSPECWMRFCPVYQVCLICAYRSVYPIIEAEPLGLEEFIFFIDYFAVVLNGLTSP